MAYKNFKVETDADGIALVTWDSPGKSMNVFDLSVIEDLDKIVTETTADAKVKGVVVTSGKDAFSGGADLTMLDFDAHGLRRSVEDQGQGSGQRGAVQGSGPPVADLPPHRNLGQAVGRGHQRPRARRRASS